MQICKMSQICYVFHKICHDLSSFFHKICLNLRTFGIIDQVHKTQLSHIVTQLHGIPPYKASVSIIDQNHKTLADNELYNKSRALLPTILILLLLTVVQLLLKETENKQ